MSNKLVEFYLSYWQHWLGLYGIHTYIDTWLFFTTFQSGLLLYFLTPLMLCALILYMSDGTYTLQSTPNYRFFEKLSTAILFSSHSFFLDICWEEITDEIFFAFCFDVWPGAYGSMKYFLQLGAVNKVGIFPRVRVKSRIVGLTSQRIRSLTCPRPAPGRINRRALRITNDEYLWIVRLVMLHQLFMSSGRNRVLSSRECNHKKHCI